MFTIFIFCWFLGSNFLVICYIGCKVLYRKQDYRLISDLIVINYSSLLQHSSISFPTPLRHYCLVNCQLRNILFPKTIFLKQIYICMLVGLLLSQRSLRLFTCHQFFLSILFKLAPNWDRKLRLQEHTLSYSPTKSNENIVGLRFLTFYSKSSKSTLKKGTACLYGLLCSG